MKKVYGFKCEGLCRINEEDYKRYQKGKVCLVGFVKKNGVERYCC